MGIKGIYEWNDTKRQTNLHKHGLDFADEERWIAIGFLKLTLCFVVYAEREGHIRLISLRKATRKERDYYAKK